MPNTVDKAIVLADELAKQGGEQNPEAVNNVTSTVLHSEGPEVVPLLVILKNSRKGETNSNANLEALQAAADLARA